MAIPFGAKYRITLCRTSVAKASTTGGVGLACQIRIRGCSMALAHAPSPGSAMLENSAYLLLADNVPVTFALSMGGEMGLWTTLAVGLLPALAMGLGFPDP
ncbi:MAG: hypothetical protein QM784_24380 [Polyangiaceae bacterium]